MKHFLGVQNGSIFVSFLCIFTNFFLILLTKRAFLRLLSCIFTNQKNYRQSTRRCRHHAGSGIQTSISAGKERAFLRPETFSLFTYLQDTTPSGASRPTPQRRQHLFLQSKSQPPGRQQPSLSPIPSNFHLSPATSNKKN